MSPLKNAGQVYTATAHPSLALVKYWGKLPGDTNLPATTSIAMTLDHLTSRVVVSAVPNRPDEIVIDGHAVDPARFTPFFDAVRQRCATHVAFAVKSQNNFPTAAGLASSSSGFAALALACSAAACNASPARFALGSPLPLPLPLPRDELSAMARVGSGSAARAVFGGFTRWSRGARSAEQLYPASHWPELRVIVVKISSQAKGVSSREAMERTRKTSPYFEAWEQDNRALAEEAVRALTERDLERLGRVARLSYLRMFATMFTAEPPVLYWLPASVEAIHACERLRRAAVPAFETMDAGPQVKVLTTAEHVDRVREELSEIAEVFAVCGPGPDAELHRGDTSR